MALDGGTRVLRHTHGYYSRPVSRHVSAGEIGHYILQVKNRSYEEFIQGNWRVDICPMPLKIKILARLLLTDCILQNMEGDSGRGV